MTEQQCPRKAPVCGEGLCAHITIGAADMRKLLLMVTASTLLAVALRRMLRPIAPLDF